MSYAYRGAAPRTLTAREQQTLLRATGERAETERDHLVLSLALGCGLREHEIAALEIQDVVRSSHVDDRGEGRIRFRLQLRTFKGCGRAPGEIQHVAIPRELRRKLERYVRRLEGPRGALLLTQPLLPSRKGGGPLTTRAIRHLFKAWQVREGFEEIHPFHRLRHTFATNLYALTMDAKVVQSAARHARMETTGIYLHASDELLARAADRLPC